MSVYSPKPSATSATKSFNMFTSFFSLMITETSVPCGQIRPIRSIILVASARSPSFSSQTSALACWASWAIFAADLACHHAPRHLLVHFLVFGNIQSAQVIDDNISEIEYFNAIHLIFLTMPVTIVNRSKERPAATLT